MLPMDACNTEISTQSIFFKDNVLSAALRKGIPTRIIGYTTQYADPALFSFANSKIYNNAISQFPNPALATSKPQTLKIVRDKISSIAEKAVQHATRNPSQTLGIVVFNQSHINEIEDAMQKLLEKNPGAAKFFAQKSITNKFYIKTAERAVDLYRDVIFICADIDHATSISGIRKISICTTLAKLSLSLFMTNEDAEKLASAKPNLFQEWIGSLKNSEIAVPQNNAAESVLDTQIKDVFTKESIAFKESIATGNIPIGPVVIDANNSKRFLAVVESDCSTSPYKESIEDREYIRPKALSSRGWKVLNMWLPLWNISNADEKENLIATIAIEQSVAPPPQEDIPLDEAEHVAAAKVEPYSVKHPASTTDKPMAELPAEALIKQLKFYVDSESPIHGELLLQRLLELHHVEHTSAKINAILSDAIKQALHQKQFIKTGLFFYSLTNKSVVLRDRSKRPDSERKMAYVPPEERALLKLDDHSLKQMLGVL